MGIFLNKLKKVWGGKMCVMYLEDMIHITCGSGVQIINYQLIFTEKKFEYF